MGKKLRKSIKITKIKKIRIRKAFNSRVRYPNLERKSKIIRPLTDEKNWRKRT